MLNSLIADLENGSVMIVFWEMEKKMERSNVTYFTGS